MITTSLRQSSAVMSHELLKNQRNYLQLLQPGHRKYGEKFFASYQKDNSAIFENFNWAGQRYVPGKWICNITARLN
jgi:hypothetical protein